MTAPPYVPRSGEQVYPPPYSAAGVQLFGFLVKADLAAQQAVCDRYLNGPLGVVGADARFVPAAAHAMFVFNTIDQLRSMTPPFDERGWFPEQEAAVWMTVCDRQREKLFWFHPYMLVDNSYALAMGREIYGFPKEFGWFQIPRGPDAPVHLSVETLAVKTFGPDAPGQRLPLFSVDRVDHVGKGGEHTLFGDLKEMVGALQRIAGLEPGFFAELGLGVHMLEDMAERLMPMVFLKQFRDGANPLATCYQAIQEVDSRLVKLHGAKLFSERYTVTINDLDSHPVRADLGLPAGPIDVEAAYWLNFDFAIGNCNVVTPTGPSALQVPPVPQVGPKKRIAILGGGAAAMAAAWRLTSEPGWQSRYEITLYQMGWRLGGKGASGRREPHGRIEEHGLHIWLGFYHNAFRALQDAHRELNPGVDESVPAGNSPPRIANGVFARCEDGFQPHSYVGIDMDLSDGWQPWMMRTPISGDKPWLGGDEPTLAEYLKYFGEFLSGKAFADDTRALYQREEHQAHGGLLDWLKRAAKELLMDAQEALWSAGFGIASALGAQLRHLPTDGAPWPATQNSLLDELVTKLQGWVAHEFERQTRDDPDARRHFFMLDMGATIVRGLLAERAWDRARFNALDDEFSVWLARHGAMPATSNLNTNPLLRGLYDFVFAFDGGNTRDLDANANFATAPALRTVMRMCFTYDGAIFWKMRAGMGDTIFTPFHKALEKRGVAFRFFHRVEALRLDAAKQNVEAIAIARQAVTTAPNGLDYDPYTSWADLDCWPSEPRYDRLLDGAALRAEVERQGVGLESFWYDGANEQALSLKRGVDFDEVVFGISLGSVPFVAAELVAANPRWQAMVDNVKTVRTMGCQLWLAPDLKALGWLGDAPVLDAYLEPFDTWADMSHLLPREVWGSGEVVPKNVAYFCGSMEGSGLDRSDKSIPAKAKAEVHDAAEQKVLAKIGGLWPAVAKPDGAIDPGVVLDRFERANIDPSELYVMSTAGSSAFRIKTDATGFANLKIAGDWIDNGFNAGCVEAAFMSGLQAANAVLGKDRNDGIVGRQLCGD